MVDGVARSLTGAWPRRCPPPGPCEESSFHYLRAHEGGKGGRARTPPDAARGGRASGGVPQAMPLEAAICSGRAGAAGLGSGGRARTLGAVDRFLGGELAPVEENFQAAFLWVACVRHARAVISNLVAEGLRVR